MTSSLVQWGGFATLACLAPSFLSTEMRRHHSCSSHQNKNTCQQHLRQSVAPGAGTIVFVNPADHPGIGTPGGGRWHTANKTDAKETYTCRQPILSKASSATSTCNRCKSWSCSALAENKVNLRTQSIADR